MTHNLGARAVLSDKIGSAMQKVGNTMKNLGKQDPTLGAPISYRVVRRRGLRARKGIEENTEVVKRLNYEDVVLVVELVGRRARIISPVEGWVTVESRQGIQVLCRCMLQNKESHNKALKQAFERRKLDQQAKENMYAEKGYTRTSAREREASCSDDSSDNDRSRDVRASSRRANDARDVVVPKLAAPGSASGPVVLAPPPNSSRPLPAVPQTSSPQDVSQRPRTPAAVPAGDCFDLLTLNAAPPAGEELSFDPSRLAAPSASPADDWADFQRASAGSGFHSNPPAQAPALEFGDFASGQAAGQVWAGAPWAQQQQQTQQIQLQMQQMQQMQLQIQQAQQVQQMQHNQQQMAQMMAAAGMQKSTPDKQLGNFPAKGVEQGMQFANWANMGA